VLAALLGLCGGGGGEEHGTFCEALNSECQFSELSSGYFLGCLLTYDILDGQS